MTRNTGCRCGPRTHCAAAFGLALLSALATPALAQPPDLKTMAGRPLPVTDLPVGTVVVRVVRGSLANPVTGVTVTATLVNAEGKRERTSATTGADGRAGFEGLQPGLGFRASATVDGEQLASSNFLIPTTGGVRVILIAGIGAEPPPEDESPIDTESRDRRFEISAMVGRIEEAPELPTGTLEIHVTGEDGQPKANFPVRLGQMSMDGSVKAYEATTDAAGLARIPSLPTDPHSAFAAVADLGGVRVGSRPFRMPAQGGLRTFLAPLRTTSDPSRLRTVSPSYLVIEFREGSLVVQSSLTIENAGEAVFKPTALGLRFELPEGFSQAQAIPDSVPLELDPGKAMVLRTPVIPSLGGRGGVNARYVFAIPTGSEPTLTLIQHFPIALSETLLLVPEGKHKLDVRGDDLRYLDSPRMETGTRVHRYKLPDLRAGAPLKLSISGYPVDRRIGHRVTASLVIALVVLGIVGALRSSPAPHVADGTRAALEARREELFLELTDVEIRLCSGQDDGALVSRRAELVGKLEAIYRELASLDRGAARSGAGAASSRPARSAQGRP